MFEPKIIDNLLTKQECSDLVLAVKNSDVWDSNKYNTLWDNRVISINTIYKKLSTDLGNLVKSKTFELKKYIELEYKLSKEVYPDTASICRWFPGMDQSPHSDDMIVHGITGYEHRVFGSIIYLNIDYNGGYTYYPEQDFKIIPETGKAIIHRGDAEHLHGVTKINDGIRYTIASFWTYEKERAIDWSLFE